MFSFTSVLKVLILTLFFGCLAFTYAKAQNDSVHHKRLTPLLVSATAGYGIAIVGMNELWYKQSPRTSFHFFDDAGEWMQMDKAGHCTSAFIESMYGVRAMQWAGLTRNKAIFWGAMSGIILQTPIEILDGFSAAYGASVSDLGANILGSALVYSQYKFWNDLRITPKFSFHQTILSNERPQVLGSNFIEKSLKDYNGQTYWLSFNIASFLPSSNKFPKWVNVSFGYGAEGMISADMNTNRSLGLKPYRQYLVGFDIDLTRLRSKSKLLNSILYNFNLLHLPGPALEFSIHGLRFHSLYF